jgi:uncharacterized protein
MPDLFKAISDNDLTRFRYLVETSPDMVDRKNEQGVSPILFAIYYGRPEYAKELVAAGAALGIHEAAALGDLEKVREILDNDPEKVNSFSGDGFQPLGLAAFFSHTEVGAYLLGHGADPEAPSRNDQRVAPLHSATASGTYQIVCELIKKGADVNAKQQGGYTALHAAIQNKDFDIIKVLIDNGADCYATNDGGVRPIDLIDDEGREIIAGLLKGCV